MDTKTLFSAPTTVAAARLANWENIVDASTLPCPLPHQGMVAFHSDGLTQSEDGFCCNVVRQVEDICGNWALLAPLHEGAPLLRMQTKGPLPSIVHVKLTLEKLQWLGE